MTKQRVPIYWDSGGVTHSCESAKYDGDVRMVWTKCGIDVLDAKAYWFAEGWRAVHGATVTCPTCIVAPQHVDILADDEETPPPVKAAGSPTRASTS